MLLLVRIYAPHTQMLRVLTYRAAAEGALFKITAFCTLCWLTLCKKNNLTVTLGAACY